jgi:hypothetical protein
MNNIILLGAGGHCKSCIDVIEKENKYKILYIIDKNNKRDKLLNYKIISENLLAKKKNLYAFVAVGQIKNYKIRQISYYESVHVTDKMVAVFLRIIL